MKDLAILDRIGIVYFIGNMLALLIFPIIASTFNVMFIEIGGSLPILTQIVIRPWFSILLGIICLFAFLLRWSKPVKGRLMRQRAILVLSILAVSAAMAICVIGIFQPIFRMASLVGAP